MCDSSDNSISIANISKYTELFNNSLTEALKYFIVDKKNKEDIPENLNEIDNKFNLKDLDRYLWQVGKEYFPKVY